MSNLRAMKSFKSNKVIGEKCDEIITRREEIVTEEEGKTIIEYKTIEENLTKKLNASSRTIKEDNLKEIIENVRGEL